MKQSLLMQTIISDIRTFLFDNKDTGYRDFYAGLCPSLDKEKIIGVRTPILRKYAKQLFKRPDVEFFLYDLPHMYYEENNLHAFIIELYCDFEVCISAIDLFLPFVDNWATCDGLRPKCFSKNKDKLISKALEWVNDDRVYVKRFGIGVLMNHYLDESFDAELLNLVASIKSDEYYINMMRAWYFATALSKQYEAVLPLLVDNKLDVWTHNKTIQKAVESYRIQKEQKDFLKLLRKK